ncbi:SusD family protein [Bacteroides pyogenes F0041]|uniref:SusD family protein n=1 Tax=Bacteroides pyogenes F0041 TaxID=1321819 RepID=U2C1T8_9BACE|nr:RagB/SusD family nutrient uptake outer membrane protein [Bacteroides pyogenes]ERI84429.1 SusD family protein [Bacteroides pyogenes F0041]
MKTLRKISIILALCLCTSIFTACSDYLNVSDDLAAELTMKEVFENTSYARRFHRNIYTGIPDVSNIIITSAYAGLNGLDNPWPAVSDELKAAQNNVKSIPTIGYHAGSAALSRWGLYKQIRQANQFMEYAHIIPAKGDQTDFIDEIELSSLKNEARFLRAYYHFLLFELYGPVPIMTEVVSPSSTDLDYYRSSVDEVVDFIDSELNACYEQLPEKEINPDGTPNQDRAGAPTKGAALAILAKLHVYAASPLLNGGYSEAIELKDNQNKQIFPTEKNSKWEKALNALQRLIDYAHTGHYSLYKVMKDGKIDPEESLYWLFQTSINNPEAIWQTSKNSWGSLNNEGRERRCTPRGIFSGFGSVGVLQEAIDDFFMIDGKSIKESPLYEENGIDDEGVPNMYKNREPRFYQNITYSGKVWQKTNKKIYFYKGTPDDNSKADMSYSGYLLYKGMNRDLLNQGSNSKSQFRAGMLFRLADFYLLYAEALNHVNPADPRIIQYVDSVRYRAGIPLLKNIKPEIIGNQEAQERAIRHERRIELFVEGQRYFDVRRWMCAEEEGYKQGGPVHGMDMNATTLVDFMKRTVFETRIFEKRMYLYPIPLDEIQRSKKLIQNPGW